MFRCFPLTEGESFSVPSSFMVSLFLYQQQQLYAFHSGSNPLPGLVILRDQTGGGRNAVVGGAKVDACLLSSACSFLDFPFNM
jgi:hypothetical protein